LKDVLTKKSTLVGSSKEEVTLKGCGRWSKGRVSSRIRGEEMPESKRIGGEGFRAGGPAAKKNAENIPHLLLEKARA